MPNTRMNKRLIRMGLNKYCCEMINKNYTSSLGLRFLIAFIKNSDTKYEVCVRIFNKKMF